MYDPASFPRPAAVFFDWDGTIVDTAEHVFAANVEAFAEFGIPIARDAFLAAYTPDWRTMFTAIGVPPPFFDSVATRYVERFAAREAHPLPGAIEAIRALHRDGIAVGVVSAGPRSIIAPQLWRFGIAELLSAAVFDGETPRGKPHPDPLVAAIALSKITGPVVYVGDAHADVEMAHAAGALGIGVATGFYGEADFLARGVAHATAPSFAAATARFTEGPPRPAVVGQVRLTRL